MCKSVLVNTGFENAHKLSHIAKNHDQTAVKAHSQHLKKHIRSYLPAMKETSNQVKDYKQLK